jgi:hypothetical protein
MADVGIAPMQVPNVCGEMLAEQVVLASALLKCSNIAKILFSSLCVHSFCQSSSNKLSRGVASLIELAFEKVHIAYIRTGLRCPVIPVWSWQPDPRFHYHSLLGRASLPRVVLTAPG